MGSSIALIQAQLRRLDQGLSFCGVGVEQLLIKLASGWQHQDILSLLKPTFKVDFSAHEGIIGLADLDLAALGLN